MGTMQNEVEARQQMTADYLEAEKELAKGLLHVRHATITCEQLADRIAASLGDTKGLAVALHLKAIYKL